MKKLISAKEIEKMIENGDTTLEIDKDTILTPLAKDMIKNNQIKLAKKESFMNNVDFKNFNLDKIVDFFKVISKDTVLRAKIVDILKKEKKFEVESNGAGFSLIKGDSIYYDELFKHLEIYFQDLIKDENKIIGVLKIEKDSFIKKTRNKEEIFIIDGEIELILNGRKYTAKEGDLITLPKNSEIKIGSKNIAKLLYIKWN